jgi:hypothetical protein
LEVDTAGLRGKTRLCRPPRTVLPVLNVAVGASASSGLRIEDERARATLEGLGAGVSRSSKLGKATASPL